MWIFQRVLAISLCLSFLVNPCNSSDRAEGRYSFSLTTFDPSGKLGQVERAEIAASLGPPLVAVILSKERQIVMAAPQILPSVLMEDDGTQRFARITSEIFIGHSGLSADGRFLMQHAQKVAVEHEFTFDEPIPVSALIEELSLLYQQYTMKPAARPLGAALLIGYVPRHSSVSSEHHHHPRLYLLGPSGNVQTFSDCAVINGNLDRTTSLRSVLDAMRTGESSSNEVEVNPTDGTTATIHSTLAKALRSALHEQATKRGKVPLTEVGPEEDPIVILSASLVEDGHFSSRRHE